MEKFKHKSFEERLNEYNGKITVCDFDWGEIDDFTEEIQKEVPMLKTTLKIDGMMCGMCEAHVNDVIRKVVPGAKKVSSSHSSGESSFVSETEADIEALKTAIAETGYKVTDVSTEEYKKNYLV